jgi:hypothetical protein
MKQAGRRRQQGKGLTSAPRNPLADARVALEEHLQIRRAMWNVADGHPQGDIYNRDSTT